MRQMDLGVSPRHLSPAEFRARKDTVPGEPLPSRFFYSVRGRSFNLLDSLRFGQWGT